MLEVAPRVRRTSWRDVFIVETRQPCVRGTSLSSPTKGTDCWASLTLTALNAHEKLVASSHLPQCKPLAAYPYLPRELRAKAARTEVAGHDLRIDYDDEGRALCIEVTAPFLVTADHLNQHMRRVSQDTVALQ